MKVSELIEWLQRLTPEYEIKLEVESGAYGTRIKEIEAFEPNHEKREYIIW